MADITNKLLKTRIQMKHDIEANWIKATNFIPFAGEIIIYDTDENHAYQRVKIGDSIHTLAALPFITTSINGEVGEVTLTAAKIGAEESGSAAAALAVAKEYTDTEISSALVALTNEEIDAICGATIYAAEDVMY